LCGAIGHFLFIIITPNRRWLRLACESPNFAPIRRFSLPAATLAFGSQQIEKGYDSAMTRLPLRILPMVLTLACVSVALVPAASARSHKSVKKTEGTKPKPEQIATYGDWGAFLAGSGKAKTCYALAQPKQREPDGLHRDPAYIFISSRPGENIRNEVSIIMGFPMKDGGDGEAQIGDASYDLVSKGKNAWVKNPAKEGELIAAMKKGATLVIKAASTHGRMTTDSYSLHGLSQALERVDKECR
jgi:invasion protein IalB